MDSLSQLKLVSFRPATFGITGCCAVELGPVFTWPTVRFSWTAAEKVPLPANSTISGTIGGVRDYGSVVLVFLDQDDRVIPVVFDQQPFQSLLTAEGCTAGELVGRRATLDGNTLQFLER